MKTLVKIAAVALVWAAIATAYWIGEGTAPAAWDLALAFCFGAFVVTLPTTAAAYMFIRAIVYVLLAGYKLLRGSP